MLIRRFETADFRALSHIGRKSDGHGSQVPCRVVLERVIARGPFLCSGAAREKPISPSFRI
jgi:hypothetical protein